MKFSISNKKELLDCLSKVTGVVERRNTLQILTNVYLQVANNQLTVKATDLEISMETSLPVKMTDPGNVTISAKSFFEIVKELPDAEIEISSKENHWVSIVCDSSKFNIMGIAPEDYPALPSFSESSFRGLHTEALLTMIERTLFAVSTDETRYHLNGVFLDHAEGDRYRMVATDGHRLAYCEKDLFSGETPFLDKGVIIPRKGVQELKKLLESGVKELMVELEGNHLIFKTSDTYLFIRLIEGRFPDYKQVIPTKNPNQIELDAKDLLLSLKRVSLLANEKSRGVKLALQDKRLEISTNNPDLGEAKESLPIKHDGDNLEIGFNAKYLMDSMSVVAEERITLSFNDRMSPGVVREPGDEDYLCVLMPMRL